MDEEDWQCKKCVTDESHSDDNTECDKCSQWYHKYAKHLKAAQKGNRTSQPIANRQSLLTIYKSFVRPHLDYGDVVYDQTHNEIGQYLKVVSIIQL